MPANEATHRLVRPWVVVLAHQVLVQRLRRLNHRAARRRVVRLEMSLAVTTTPKKIISANNQT